MSPEALLAEARAATANAYAPYSRFVVGAAILTVENKLVRGVNVENASYGLSICAEATAITSAVAAGARQIKAVAVVGGPIDDNGVRALATPCGRCRQIIAEFATADLIVHVGDMAGLERLDITLAELLPHPFRLIE